MCSHFHAFVYDSIYRCVSPDMGIIHRSSDDDGGGRSCCSSRGSSPLRGRANGMGMFELDHQSLDLEGMDGSASRGGGGGGGGGSRSLPPRVNLNLCRSQWHTSYILPASQLPRGNTGPAVWQVCII